MNQKKINPDFLLFFGGMIACFWLLRAKFKWTVSGAIISTPIFSAVAWIICVRIFYGPSVRKMASPLEMTKTVYAPAQAPKM